MGITVPQWLLLDENKTAIQTGSNIADNVLYVLLSTGMFVGGVLGFILDNTIPGTDEERGIKKWREKESSGLPKNSATIRRLAKIYDFPCGMSVIRKVKWFRRIPLCPTYGMSQDEIDEMQIMLKKQDNE